MISMIFLSILWFTTWMLLTWPPEPKDAYLGVAVAIFVTYMTGHMFSKDINPFKRPSRYAWFICYCAVFFQSCFIWPQVTVAMFFNNGGLSGCRDI